MDILIVAKRLDHGFVVRHMSKHPELDLGIIRVHQHQPSRATKTLRISRPKAVRTGYSVSWFCRADAPRLVTVWLKEEWMRPSFSPITWERPST
jgi:hypothetical protein